MLTSKRLGPGCCLLRCWFSASLCRPASCRGQLRGNLMAVVLEDCWAAYAPGRPKIILQKALDSGAFSPVMGEHHEVWPCNVLPRISRVRIVRRRSGG